MRTMLTRRLLTMGLMLIAVLAAEAVEAGHRHRGTSATGIYPAPHPVPEWVGITPYMYQPLYPHEFMHKHLHVYRRYTGSRLIPSNTTKALYW